MSISLPVIVGAGAVIVALLCIGVGARRRPVHANAPAAEPVEAVFVHDIAAPGPLLSAPEPQPAPAQVYPVHKLVQAVADGPITFGPTRREPMSAAPVREPSFPEPGPELELVVEPLPVVPFDQETELDVPAPVAPRLEVEPEPEIAPAPAVSPEPEVTVPEPQLQPFAPIMAREPVIDLPVAPQREPDPATVPEPAVAKPEPAAEVVMLTTQIEVLTETIARLTDRIEAVAATATIPAAQPEPELELDVEPEFVPESFVSRAVAPDLDEFALEVELEPEPQAEPEPEAITRPERSPRPPLNRRLAAEPTAYARRRVDDDLLAWPSDEELERYSGRQARRDA